MKQYTAERSRFPIDTKMPAMQRVGKNIGETIEAYLQAYIHSDDPYIQARAGVVGRMYDSLIANAMVCPPLRGQARSQAKPEKKSRRSSS